MEMQKSYLLDMNGVLLKNSRLIPGAAEFVQRLFARNIPFLILTNSSFYTPRAWQTYLHTLGLDVPEEVIFTSALATAQFLQMQQPEGHAFVIGASGLTTALHDVGYVLTNQTPDYVILGETTSYSFELMTTAIRFVLAGVKFVATNPDLITLREENSLLSTGAIVALISSATGKIPYTVGKPNPLMIWIALRMLHAHSYDAVMIGDTMETDIIAGIETGMQTIMLLTGTETREHVARCSYQPTWIRDSIADIE